MLTDIFANRYSKVTIWEEFGEAERRLLVQTFRLLDEQVCPDQIENKDGKEFWTDIQNRLSMELGLPSLSNLYYTYTWQNNVRTPHEWPMNSVCKNWVLKEFDSSVSADQFVKERMSLVELGFRKREEGIAAENAEFPQEIAKAVASDYRRAKAASSTRKHSSLRVPGDSVVAVQAHNKSMNERFNEAVHELNTRFSQAQCGLHYHNGFIQRAEDELISEYVEAPFWNLVADPKWKNVDTDMKKALDSLDSDAGNPALYALCALESTLKIVSDERGWSDSGEANARRHIEYLASGKVKFLANWEACILKEIFAKIRNPLGHGSGEQEMFELDKQQTDWVLKSCMIWIKSIVCRL